MPKNKVSDPITDQEIAFARLVLSGGMTDRQAAEAAEIVCQQDMARCGIGPGRRDCFLESTVIVRRLLWFDRKSNP